MQRVEKNRQYAYRDRKNKKREFRKNYGLSELMQHLEHWV